ncbi:hypothetical protein Rs2_38705 [Raphanus sativus]|nr:hypothetical protein Rs2_38705 [Raphanus sativus]
MVKGDLHLTLITLSCSDGITEYKLRNRGFSLPFAKAIAVLTPEMIDKGEMAMKCFKGNVLNLKLHDIGNFFGAREDTNQVRASGSARQVDDEPTTEAESLIPFTRP